MVNKILTLGILLIEGADIEGVGRVDLAARGYEGRRVPLLINLTPVVAREERVVLEFVGTAATTA
jgi:hypothetical protein